jgi:predicted metal-dependent hydrolase
MNEFTFQKQKNAGVPVPRMEPLQFSWKLVMCPLSVIDYVVVHELSHIVYKNHNDLFWARVKTVFPNFKEPQNWLKLNRKMMEIE